MSTLARLFMLLVLLGAGLLLPARPSFACSCMVPPPPLEAFNEATAVFAGRVTERPTPPNNVGSSADPLPITFEVSQVWKGPQSQTLIVQTARESASCGYNFEVDQEYIVYSYADGGQLSTNLCSRTSLLANAQEDLEALGEGTVPAAPEEPAGEPEVNPTAAEETGSSLLLWASIAGALLLGALTLFFLRRQ